MKKQHAVRCPDPCTSRVDLAGEVERWLEHARIRSKLAMRQLICWDNVTEYKSLRAKVARWAGKGSGSRRENVHVAMLDLNPVNDGEEQEEQSWGYERQDRYGEYGWYGDEGWRG